ncbi:copper resistance D family protein [Pseudoalteromonas sp. T1lg10]|uniref:copper resistance D family protein n=1 Tax=Pseudoalteromonas sp. T1lg10 TaxID=2077093 RepID=UPI000CF5E6C4|nr:CopD family protein [Pseudoalteromonas sp. T1lg10]
MDVFIWNTIIVLAKMAFYAGFAGVAGYAFLGQVFAHEQDPLRPGVLSGICLPLSLVLLAFVGNVVWFFANTGAMAEDGIGGAFDSFILEIMWDSSIGATAQVRALGCLAALGAVMLLACSAKATLVKWARHGLFAASLLMLAYSFTLVGHVSELTALEKALLMVHVVVMAWWFGALYPLKHAVEVLNDDGLIALMNRFSRQASVLVGVLLLAGAYMALQLLSSPVALFASSYGQTLLLKLVLVLCILALAARHKFILVPRLNNPDGRAALANSITLEMVIAGAILAVTACLTSVVGPTN